MIYHKGEKVLLPQDLHIHTTFSVRDDSVASQQTIELIDKFRYAHKMGIDIVLIIEKETSYDKKHNF